MVQTKIIKYMKRGIIIVLITVAIIVFVLVQKKADNSPREDNSVTIGAVLPLTGTLAFIGEDMRNGMKLAAEETNLTLIVSDGEANPQKSLSAARQLVDLEKVPVLLTAFRGATLSIASSFTNRDVIIGSITATTEGKTVSTSTPNLFVMGPEIISSAEVLGSYAKEHSLCTAAGALLEQTDVAKDKVFGFTRGVDNGQLAQTDIFDPVATDWRTSIAKFKQSKIDCIFVEIRSNSLPILLKQFDENKFYPKIFTTSYSFTPTVAKLTPKVQLENLFYSTSLLQKNDSGEGFFERYKEVYGREATDFAAMAYEFIKILEKPIKECGGNTSCIKKRMSDINGMSSIVGNLTMNEDREIHLGGYSLFTTVQGKSQEI